MGERGGGDYSRIRKLPVNFISELAQSQSAFQSSEMAAAIIMLDSCPHIACHSCHYGQTEQVARQNLNHSLS